jgi:mannosyltransferase
MLQDPSSSLPGSRSLIKRYEGLFHWEFLEKKSDYALILIPTFLLLVAVLPFIGNSYWDDEIFSVWASRSWSGLFKVFRDYENNMSLYLIILHFWMKVFGETEVATHALSLVFAVATLPVFYSLERTWFNKTTALVGAMLVVANPIFLYYAVESRSYSLLILSATSSTLILVRLLEKPGLLLGLCYGLSIVLGVYVHYFGILLVPVHALSLAYKNLNRSTIPSFILSALVVLLGLLPLLLFPPHSHNQIDWLARPEFRDFKYAVKDLSGGKWADLLLAVCFLLTLKNHYWKKIPDQGYFLPVLSLAWTVLPAILAFLVSDFVKPAFLTRYFVWCLPGAAILTCLVIGQATRNFLVKSILVILLVCLSIPQAYHALATKGAGFKEAARYLQLHSSPGEAVIAYPFNRAMHISFYLDLMKSSNTFARPQAITSAPWLPGGGGVDPDPDMEEIGRIARSSSKVYVVCKQTKDFNRVDTICNRGWLPEIQQTIAQEHPSQTQEIFGKGTLEQVRVLVFQ